MELILEDGCLWIPAWGFNAWGSSVLPSAMIGKKMGFPVTFLEEFAKEEGVVLQKVKLPETWQTIVRYRDLLGTEWIQILDDQEVIRMRIICIRSGGKIIVCWLRFF
ncbi:MAG: hypothetical protein QY314_02595 [Candidatus Dojkabacteria bacterium]|nr:MAG: hypothetical protein QY314_02595 [Candidatus Dojkabacteria bacterium]